MGVKGRLSIKRSLYKRKSRNTPLNTLGFFHWRHGQNRRERDGLVYPLPPEPSLGFG